MESKYYFLGIAQAASEKSKDPSTRVGSVIVDEDNRIVSTGYNGFVAGCDESYMSFERPAKYGVTIHAEMNALLFARRSLKGCAIYCTHAPCDNCLKHILQSGITTVVYDQLGETAKRFSKDQLDAIVRLCKSMRHECVIVNKNDTEYVQELINEGLWKE